MPTMPTWVRRQPLLARPGTPVWTTVQTQPNEALRQQLIALAARLGAAAWRALRADPPSGLHGRGVGEPRAAVPLRFAAGRARRRDAAAGDDAGTAEPGTGTDGAVGGGGKLCRHGRLECAGSAGRGVAGRTGSAAVADLVGADVPIRAAAIGGQRPGAGRARRARGRQGLRTHAQRRAVVAAQTRCRRHERHVGRVRLDRPGAFGPRPVDYQRRSPPRGRSGTSVRPNCSANLAVRKLNTVQTLAGQLAARTPVADAARWLDAARRVCKRATVNSPRAMPPAPCKTPNGRCGRCDWWNAPIGTPP